ncbi:unnamed protein product [Linum tenue]|uniref:E2F/DP family winged-helix DNA-binding domain-containing protein n=1 Tax=Linum tenue TaxID=586396 RepID=A0AAV0ILU9_9ROSI|nr:unnamed protein product [Linum tenue]
MSNSEPPTGPGATPPPPNQQQQSTPSTVVSSPSFNVPKRQLAFSSVKPPFSSPGDYHRFTTDPRRAADREPEGIVVKSPPLKQSGDTAAHETESSEWNITSAYTEVANTPIRTPLSGKGGKAPKASKGSRSTKSAQQNANANIGSPGNNLTPTGPCRYDSSLGLLTKKFINLFKHAEDGILDLNKAADTLEAEVENLTIEERNFDERIRFFHCLKTSAREMQERLTALSEDGNNQRFLFVTEDDIKTLPCFQNETLIAIKAPHGTTLEVPDPDEAVDHAQRRYRIVVRSTMGPVDVYLVSKFEEKFEEIQGVEPPAPSLPSTSGVNDNPTTSTVVKEESREGKEIAGTEQGQDVLYSEQDLFSGIMKIVPSDADSDADYWLLSDAGVSITDIWRTDPGLEWNELGGLHDDYGISGISSSMPANPQTPPPSNPTTEPPPSAANATPR